MLATKKILQACALVLLVAAVSADGDAAAIGKSWLASMAQAISGEDSIGQLTAAVFSNPALLSAGSMKLGFLVNELRSPGIRAAERVQQLVNIATDIGAVTGDCAAYTFTPGGDPTNAKWIGPTFTLTQTTGSCILQPVISGAGNTRWTTVGETLACLGPSTQWGWTPLTYEGISREATMLEGPSCKFEYKLGAEAAIKVTSDLGKTKYATEKEFYTAAVLNTTMDSQILLLKTALAQLEESAPEARNMVEGVLGLGASPSWRLAARPGAFQLAGTNNAGGPMEMLRNRVAEGSMVRRGLGSRGLFSFRSG